VERGKKLDTPIVQVNTLNVDQGSMLWSRFSAILGKKLAFFLKNQCHELIFAQLSSVVSKIRQCFFFLYGPPKVPCCRRSFGKVRPLRLSVRSWRLFLLLSSWNIDVGFQGFIWGYLGYIVESLNV
jgi:hypothetical protein